MIYYENKHKICDLILNFSKINLIIFSIWWFFVAIELAEPRVGPVNQWAIHLTGSLAGPFFKPAWNIIQPSCKKRWPST
jgi:hypothetical protein